MSTGYFSGGRELTAGEARAAGLPVGDPSELPRFTVPRYQTGEQLFTREDLLELFESKWGNSTNAGDVDAFVKRHFWERTYAVPTDYVPYPPMPELPDSMDERDRANAISEYEEARSQTRRRRELYRIDGLPWFVPSVEKPSVNNTPQQNAAAVRRIESL